MGLWDAVTEHGRTVHFGPGDALLHHGEATRHCYAILDGEVLVSATSTTGATVILGRRGAGTVVGELGSLDGQPRTATVRAVGDVTAVVLTADEFARVLGELPDLAVSELRRLAAQLRELSDRYSIRGEEVRLRILQLLETHASLSSDPVFRSTRAELASWVGATREAVTRTLKDMESDGVVELGRGAVELVHRA